MNYPLQIEQELLRRQEEQKTEARKVLQEMADLVAQPGWKRLVATLEGEQRSAHNGMMTSLNPTSVMVNRAAYLVLERIINWPAAMVRAHAPTVHVPTEENPTDPRVAWDVPENLSSTEDTA